MPPDTQNETQDANVSTRDAPELEVLTSEPFLWDAGDNTLLKPCSLHIFQEIMRKYHEEGPDVNDASESEEMDGDFGIQGGGEGVFSWYSCKMMSYFDIMHRGLPYWSRIAQSVMRSRGPMSNGGGRMLATVLDWTWLFTNR